MFCGISIKKGENKKRRKKLTRRLMGSGTIRNLGAGRHKPYAAYLPRSLGEKYIGSFATAAEADIAIALARTNRLTTSRADWTVEDFYNFYVNSESFSDKAQGTRGSVKSSWRYCEQIKDIKMCQVKTQEWQNCVDLALMQGKSSSTCRNIKDLASALCKEAMRDDVITKNYSTLINMPKDTTRKKDILKETEIELLKAHDNDWRVRLILILAYTGMRIGELLTMLNDNVYDKYMVGGEKTEAGKNRIIPILPEISQYIIRLKSEGEKYLVNKNGRRMTENYFRKYVFYACMVELEIMTAEETQIGGKPRLTPHCMRRTFATKARQAGIEKDVLKRVVGHTEYETTDKHYIDMQAEYLCAELMKMSNQVTTALQ
ncbi:MAG: site-specific integrase [Oscillospiraceae bacterium]|jgi:integrase|nr:site-specific integrase [Oscillospiraceae bacterium]